MAGVIAGLILASTALAAPAGLHIEQADNTVRVALGERLVLACSFDQDLPKPFVHPLCTPAGQEVTMLSPPDHQHHRGLMFALGSVAFAGEQGHVVFWGEEGPPPYLGYIEHKGFDVLKADKARAIMVSRLEWRRHSDDALMLTEKRRIEVYALKDLGCNLVSWESDLTAPDRGIVIGPTPGREVSYYGLGLRVPRDMDGGQVFDGNGKSGEQAVNGDDARWCAYVGPKEPVRGFAMFDHPANPRHPTGWFVMSAGFGYMTASVVCHQELTLPRGETLRLRYGVCAFDGTKTAEEIEGTYKRWVGLEK